MSVFPFRQISRRRCLAAAGGSLVLPVFESSSRSRISAADEDRIGARAAEPGQVLDAPASVAPRMVCMGVSLSMYPGAWNPKETGTQYDTPELIEPLDGLRNEFTLISNADHPGVTGGHRGTPAFLSGVYRPERVGQSIVIRNQITLDQVVARQLGDETRFQSLQFGAADVGLSDSLSWDEKGVPLPALSDPLAIFGQLFVDDNDPEKTA
ncbi:MAG: DUF1552 domain-containing protein, partial [Planctomycetota bacterium]